MHNKEMEQCASTCCECEIVCIDTLRHCLEKGGKHAAVTHIVLLQDCADICATSARFLSRGSQRHMNTCRICAEICEACAQSCERIDSSDPQMKKCIEICRRCAQSCRQMAGA